MTAPVLLKGEPRNLPDRLGIALPGQVGLGQGLPEAERSEPLTGPAWAGSRLAGGREGTPFLIASPSGEEMLLILQGLDQIERDAVQALYQGISNPQQCTARIYEVHNWKVCVLHALGRDDLAEEIEERLSREMTA